MHTRRQQTREYRWLGLGLVGVIAWLSPPCRGTHQRLAPGCGRPQTARGATYGALMPTDGSIYVYDASGSMMKWMEGHEGVVFCLCVQGDLRVRRAQWLVCWGCALCGMVRRLRVSGIQ